MLGHEGTCDYPGRIQGKFLIHINLPLFLFVEFRFDAELQEIWIYFN